MPIITKEQSQAQGNAKVGGQTSDLGTWRWAAGDKGEEMGSAHEPRE